MLKVYQFVLEKRGSGFKDFEWKVKDEFTLSFSSEVRALFSSIVFPYSFFKDMMVSAFKETKSNDYYLHNYTKIINKMVKDFEMSCEVMSDYPCFDWNRNIGDYFPIGFDSRFVLPSRVRFRLFVERV